jgi:hypothetical protein
MHSEKISAPRGENCWPPDGTLFNENRVTQNLPGCKPSGKVSFALAISSNWALLLLAGHTQKPSPLSIHPIDGVLAKDPQKSRGIPSDTFDRGLIGARNHAMMYQHKKASRPILF